MKRKKINDEAYRNVDKSEVLKAINMLGYVVTDEIYRIVSCSTKVKGDTLYYDMSSASKPKSTRVYEFYTYSNIYSKKLIKGWELMSISELDNVKKKNICMRYNEMVDIFWEVIERVNVVIDSYVYNDRVAESIKKLLHNKTIDILDDVKILCQK